MNNDEKSNVEKVTTKMSPLKENLHVLLIYLIILAVQWVFIKPLQPLESGIIWFTSGFLVVIPYLLARIINFVINLFRKQKRTYSLFVLWFIFFIVAGPMVYINYLRLKPLFDIQQKFEMECIEKKGYGYAKLTENGHQITPKEISSSCNAASNKFREIVLLCRGRSDAENCITASLPDYMRTPINKPKATYPTISKLKKSKLILKIPESFTLDVDTTSTKENGVKEQKIIYTFKNDSDNKIAPFINELILDVPKGVSLGQGESTLLDFFSKVIKGSAVKKNCKVEDATPEAWKNKLPNKSMFSYECPNMAGYGAIIESDPGRLFIVDYAFRNTDKITPDYTTEIMGFFNEITYCSQLGACTRLDGTPVSKSRSIK